MRNEKGFTLVELLAVIVILAVIALIATPIILGLINESRQKAAADSAWGTIKAVELAYARTESAPTSVTVTWASGEISTTDSVSSLVTLNGQKPTSGSVTVNSTGTTTISNLKFGNYTCNFKTNSTTEIECTS